MACTRIATRLIRSPACASPHRPSCRPWSGTSWSGMSRNMAIPPTSVASPLPLPSLLFPPLLPSPLLPPPAPASLFPATAAVPAAPPALAAVPPAAVPPAAPAVQLPAHPLGHGQCREQPFVPPQPCALRPAGGGHGDLHPAPGQPAVTQPRVHLLGERLGGEDHWLRLRCGRIELGGQAQCG